MSEGYEGTSELPGRHCVVVSTFKSVCIVFVCACKAGLNWCFEAFVDVKIFGAGDVLLSSAAGKPRYVVYSSRVCVENRCVSTPARKGHVEPRALDAAQVFFSSFLDVFSNLPVSGIQGQTEIIISPKPQTFPFGVNSNHQRATADVYDCFFLIRMGPMNKSDELFGGEGNVRAARVATRCCK